MESQDVADQCREEVALVPFMVELLADLLRSGPAVWHEGHGLGEVLNGRRHGGLLKMSELRSMTVGIVHKKMLKEVDRVEDRDEFHGHQVFVGPQGLGFGADGGVASQPLQERLVFLSHISFQVLQVVLLSILLPGMWCTELLCEFVGPGHL